MNIKKPKSQHELILEKLSSGMTEKQVIAQGFAKSTVYQVAKHFTQPDKSKATEFVTLDTLIEHSTYNDELFDYTDSQIRNLKQRIERLERQISTLATELDSYTPLLAAIHYVLLKVAISTGADETCIDRNIEFQKQEVEHKLFSAAIEKA